MKQTYAYPLALHVTINHTNTPMIISIYPSGTDPDPAHPRTEEGTLPDTVPPTPHHAALGAGPPPPDGTIWQRMVAACQ